MLSGAVEILLIGIPSAAACSCDILMDPCLVESPLTESLAGGATATSGVSEVFTPPVESTAPLAASSPEASDVFDLAPS